MKKEGARPWFFQETAPSFNKLYKALGAQPLEQPPRAQAGLPPAAASAHGSPLAFRHLPQPLPRLAGRKALPRLEPHRCQGGGVPAGHVAGAVGAALSRAQVGTGGAQGIRPGAEGEILPRLQGGKGALHLGGEGLVVAAALEQGGAKQVVAPQARHEKVTRRARFKARTTARAAP